MADKIYGVDPDTKLTPKIVLKAILECFYQAHCVDTDFPGDEKTTRAYCESVVRKAFKEAEADFDNPTKDGLMNAIQELAEFSRAFRSKDLIDKHFNEIKVLIDKLN
ncbi:MAG: hypothetical protein PHS44_04500 [Candidatus Dojkabacteria bacterium]|nr:hypothetical protein [Candidatus Dojkabacteria bacterium]